MIIFLALFVLLFIKEWIRPEKNNLTWRVLASALMIVALASLFFKPAFVWSDQDKMAILITDGYEINQLDSLHSILPTADLINYSDGIKGSHILDSFDSVLIVGSGVPVYDLWQWKGLRTSFVPSVSREGLIDLTYNDEVIASETVRVRLKYKGNGQYRKIILGGLGGKLDSAEILYTGHQTVELSSNHQLSEGQYLLNISVEDSLGSILEKDTLPLTVLPVPILKILIVNQFPTFDTKYLKAFLAELGHQVVVRNQVSKNTFRYEYYNTSKTTSVLTENSLEETDLLIMDKTAFDLLSGREKNIIDKAISEFGLGLFLQPTESLFKENNLLNFKLIASISTDCQIEIEDKTIKLPKYGFEIKPSYRDQSIITTRDGNSISAYERKGLGRVGTALFYDSYRLLLNGESEKYAALWSKMIDAMGRNKQLPFQIHVKSSEIVSTDDPLKIEVVADQDFKVSIAETQVAMMQDINLHYHWWGDYWPKTSGWHSIMMNDSLNAKSFYVFSPSSWRNWRYYKRTLANQRFFSQRNNENSKAIGIRKSINPICFMLLFVLSAGYLWLEPKW